MLRAQALAFEQLGIRPADCMEPRAGGMVINFLFSMTVACIKTAILTSVLWLFAKRVAYNRTTRPRNPRHLDTEGGRNS